MKNNDEAGESVCHIYLIAKGTLIVIRSSCRRC